LLSIPLGKPPHFDAEELLLVDERIMMPKRGGGEFGFSKNQQLLNPKQEPNFTQLLAIRDYY
jgi:hypothetical protein